MGTAFPLEKSKGKYLSISIDFPAVPVLIFPRK